MSDKDRQPTSAKHIEELEAACWRMQEERDRAIGWRDSDKDRADAAEAKLAKALEFIQDLTGCEWPYDEDAKRILEELTSNEAAYSEAKGGKDE